MEANNKGYVITASISSVKKIECDEFWLITRSEKSWPGSKWVPELAPNRELFNAYSNEWKGKSPEEWWPLYRSMFNKELRSEGKLSILRDLWVKVKQGKVITLVCFCKENTYCHRKLVGEFLEEQGLRVEEFNSPLPEIELKFTQPALF